MQSERAEVFCDLRRLSRNMLDVADAMWRLGAGAEVDAHARELTAYDLSYISAIADKLG